jgi:hypothetical protein
MSYLWWDYLSIDLLLIGSVDAFIVAFLVSFIVIYFLNRIKEASIINDKLTREIKTLRGILPICCNCNSIRDEEGLWKRIEAYI